MIQMMKNPPTEDADGALLLAILATALLALAVAWWAMGYADDTFNPTISTLEPR